MEIKPSIINTARGIETADSVVNLVHRLKAQAWIHYTSYAYEQLLELIKQDPSAKTGHLGNNLTPADLKRNGVFEIDYSIDVYKANEKLITDAKLYGIYLSAYTVDSNKDMLYWQSKNPMPWLQTIQPPRY